ncbi:MAG: patatin-like phospholipase family protein [Leptospirales bacterium]|nr:patatin-like phospholipase family protein [Leptospirales bacterium]
MAIPLRGRQRRIGVALSGGGYRAAALHLGLFDALSELELLQRVDMFSGVSGGSIAACALLAAPDVHSGRHFLAEFLQKESLAVGSVLQSVIHPFRTRIEALSGYLQSRLLDRAGRNAPLRTLGDLALGPRLYINSANLASGNLFFAVTGQHGLPRTPLQIGIGEWQLGFHNYPAMSIARALAASCAFPPIFNPLPLGADEFPQHPGITLTDGGVYENLGVRPLLHPRFARLDYVIVSDGGRPLALQDRSTRSGLSTLLRSLDIMMENIRGLVLQQMMSLYRHSGGPRPLWFSINSAEGSDAQTAEWAASIATDLSALAAADLQRLRTHGRKLCLARLERYAPELMRARKHR